MAFLPEEHPLTIYIFMSQIGKTQFYLRMTFPKRQCLLRYFHHLSFVEQASPFKEGQFGSSHVASARSS